MSDNFEEDITISPCVDCCWKNTDKCKRCVNRNRTSPIRYWTPPLSPTVNDNTYLCREGIKTSMFFKPKNVNDWDEFIKNTLSKVR